MGVVFDKLGFMRKLESGGAFSRPQAESLSEALHDAVAESVATKQDVTEQGQQLRHEMAILRAELTKDKTELRADMNHDMAELRSDMRQEMSELRAEFKQDNLMLRSDVKSDFALLREEMAGLRASISEAKVWGIGIGAYVVAVLSAMKFIG